MNNYSLEELRALLGAVGSHVHVHRSVEFFNPKKITLGSHVRIDCFCVLSAGKEGIDIRNYIHIAANTHLFGSGGQILIEDFSNLSSRVSLFTSNDDYVEGHLSNPTIPENYKKVKQGPVILRKHAIVGCGSILLPSVEVGLGGAIGALSLVKKDVPEFFIMGGVPARKLGERSKELLNKEKEFLKAHA